MEKKIKVNGRFYIDENMDGWQVVDSIDSTTIQAKNKTDALKIKSFAIAYTRLHGDIDFSSFPYTLEQPLNYDINDLDYREREVKEDLYKPNYQNRKTSLLHRIDNIYPPHVLTYPN